MSKLRTAALELLRAYPALAHLEDVFASSKRVSRLNVLDIALEPARDLRSEMSQLTNALYGDAMIRLLGSPRTENRIFVCSDQASATVYQAEPAKRIFREDQNEYTAGELGYDAALRYAEAVPAHDGQALVYATSQAWQETEGLSRTEEHADVLYFNLFCVPDKMLRDCLTMIPEYLRSALRNELNHNTPMWQQIPCALRWRTLVEEFPELSRTVEPNDVGFFSNCTVDSLVGSSSRAKYQEILSRAPLIESVHGTRKLSTYAKLSNGELLSPEPADVSAKRENDSECLNDLLGQTEESDIDWIAEVERYQSVDGSVGINATFLQCALA